MTWLTSSSQGSALSLETLYHRTSTESYSLMRMGFRQFMPDVEETTDCDFILCLHLLMMRMRVCIDSKMYIHEGYDMELFYKRCMGVQEML